MYEDTLGPKEGSKQEAVHLIVRSQDGKSQRSTEYVQRLKKVARKIERGREWQRWYDEVYGERLWEVGDGMLVTEVFVDAWYASDEEEGCECGGNTPC
jgi:hypothetical protein